MEKHKKEQILIPEGCFEGYCGDCFHAKKKFVNSRGEELSTQEGEIFCKHHKQIYPESDKGYNCYEGRIVTWIKCAAGLCVALAGLELIFTLLF